MERRTSNQAHGLDAKKKTLGATERKEEARSIWREQMKQVDASLMVIVDEMGSNIGLTPLYAWARHPDSEPMVVSRAITARIRPCWLPFRSQGWEQQ